MRALLVFVWSVISAHGFTVTLQTSSDFCEGSRFTLRITRQSGDTSSAVALVPTANDTFVQLASGQPNSIPSGQNFADQIFDILQDNWWYWSPRSAIVQYVEQVDEASVVFGPFQICETTLAADLITSCNSTTLVTNTVISCNFRRNFYPDPRETGINVQATLAGTLPDSRFQLVSSQFLSPMTPAMRIYNTNLSLPFTFNAIGLCADVPRSYSLRPSGVQVFPTTLPYASLNTKSFSGPVLSYVSTIAPAIVLTDLSTVARGSSGSLRVTRNMLTAFTVAFTSNRTDLIAAPASINFGVTSTCGLSSLSATVAASSGSLQAPTPVLITATSVSDGTVTARVVITVTGIPDPCLSGVNGGCDLNATCTNNNGVASCACNSGFAGDGTVCVTGCSAASLGLDSSMSAASCGLPVAISASCNIGCANGYAGATVSRTCNAINTWTGTNPTCTVKQCSVASLGLQASHATACVGSVNYGTSCSVACGIGFSGTSVSRQCVDTNTWSNSNPSCAVAQCTQQSLGLNVSHSAAACAFPVNYGSSCTVNCGAGYLGDGTARTCTGANTWNNENPGCSAITCSETSLQLGNGQVTACSFPASFGSSCTVACDVAFSGQSAQRQCVGQNVWSSVNPTCTAKTCDLASLQLTSGQITMSCTFPVAFDNVCNLACDAGLSGQPTQRRCVGDNQWDAQNPTCSGITCSVGSLGLTAGATTSCMGVINYGASCAVTCTFGYSGTPTARTCGDTDVWTGSNPVCDVNACATSNVDCPANLAPATVVASGVTFGPSVVTIKVGQNVTWTNGGGTHSVTADDGLWSIAASASAWTYRRRFLAAGTFGYHCTVHQASGMVGTVTVTAATASATCNGGCDPNFATCTPQGASRVCTCVAGYAGSDGTSCAPITCALSSLRTNESHVHSCADPVPFQAQCTVSCADGYSGTPVNRACVGVNTWSTDNPFCRPDNTVCASNNGGCDTHASCTPLETMGERACTCIQGYSGPGNTRDPASCFEINNCMTANGGCDGNATCVKTGPGTHTCPCNDGYQDTLGVCTAITCTTASLALGAGQTTGCSGVQGFHAECVVRCASGYAGSSQARTCVGINAWSTSNPTCTAITCSSASLSLSGSQRSTNCTFPVGAGALCAISCASGNSGLATVRQCTDVETWVGPNPTCIPISCSRGSLGLSPAHTTTCGSVEVFGVSCPINCTVGYTGGSAIRTCVDLNQYSGANPTCTAITCTAASLSLTTGQSTNCSGVVSFNGVCSVACVTGYAGAAAWRTCATHNGYTSTNPSCVAINPCLTAYGGCDGNATCTFNAPGDSSCQCNSGYAGSGVSCVAINHCATNHGGCDSHANCTYTGPGLHRCVCQQGFVGNGVNCTVSISICATNNGACDTHALCTPTEFGRSCQCNMGYSGDGNSSTPASCTAINPCNIFHGGCSESATCVYNNVPGERDCICNSGYEGSGLACEVVNMCLSSNGGCDEHASCQMIGPNQPSCTCNPGYHGEGHICYENICLNNNGLCDAHALCTPVLTGRTCMCNAGYTGNGNVCTVAVTASVRIVSTTAGANCATIVVTGASIQVCNGAGLVGQNVSVTHGTPENIDGIESLFTGLALPAFSLNRADTSSGSPLTGNFGSGDFLTVSICNASLSSNKQYQLFVKLGSLYSSTLAHCLLLQTATVPDLAAVHRLNCWTFPVCHTSTFVAGPSNFNECSLNHGGCHALASCTDPSFAVAGDVSCVCPSGYTGNGISCQVTPRITVTFCPVNIDVIADVGFSTKQVSWNTPTATSNIDGALPTVLTTDARYQSGQEFPIGSRTVSFTFTDSSSAVSTCSFTVNVRAPACTSTVVDVNLGKMLGDWPREPTPVTVPRSSNCNQRPSVINFQFADLVDVS